METKLHIIKTLAIAFSFVTVTVGNAEEDEESGEVTLFFDVESF